MRLKQILTAAMLLAAVTAWAQSAGDNGAYFTAPTTADAAIDNEGFIRHWRILEPIEKPNRSNTVFTDSYLNQVLDSIYFPGQLTTLPRDGQTVKVEGKKLKWHDLESTGYNVQLYRFATTHEKQKYGVLFWVATEIDCPEEQTVRLAVGSNSASMWWLNGERVLTLSGDRRMVVDDAMSKRITLKKGKNLLWGAIINGPGMSNFCVRFVK